MIPIKKTVLWEEHFVPLLSKRLFDKPVSRMLDGLLYFMIVVACFSNVHTSTHSAQLFRDEGLVFTSAPSKSIFMSWSGSNCKGTSCARTPPAGGRVRSPCSSDSGYSLPCFSFSIWWHSLRAGPSFRPMYFMIMSLRSSIKALPSISCKQKTAESRMLFNKCVFTLMNSL